MSTVIQKELSMKNSCVQFMFAYQQRNVDRMLSFCDTEGSVHFLPLGEGGKGKIGELGKAIWTSLIDAFPDIDNTLDAAVAEGDDQVRCQVVIRGTQAKDFGGITSKGQTFDSDHIFVFRLNQHNKINSITVSWDNQDLCKQLGA